MNSRQLCLYTIHFQQKEKFWASGGEIKSVSLSSCVSFFWKLFFGFTSFYWYMLPCNAQKIVTNTWTCPSVKKIWICYKTCLLQIFVKNSMWSTKFIKTCFNYKVVNSISLSLFCTPLLAFTNISNSCIAPKNKTISFHSPLEDSSKINLRILSGTWKQANALNNERNLFIN